jgi:hypothetical protein
VPWQPLRFDLGDFSFVGGLNQILGGRRVFLLALRTRINSISIQARPGDFPGIEQIPYMVLIDKRASNLLCPFVSGLRTLVQAVRLLSDIAKGFY